MNVYFDNAATTKVRDEVIDDISNVLKDCFGNPSSTHSFGRSAKSYIETSRKSIAKIINCDPAEIICFTPRSFTAHFKIELSDSVPPELKIISPGSQFRIFAIDFLDVSI